MIPAVIFVHLFMSCRYDGSTCHFSVSSAQIFLLNNWFNYNSEAMIQKTLPNLINLKMKETTREKETNVQNKVQDWDGYQVKQHLMCLIYF